MNTSQDQDQCQEEYLSLVQMLPDIFTDYGSIPDKIYIRECYRELYDLASATMMDPQYVKHKSATLFTGVPGIGKSLFMVYFIYRFLQDERFPNKNFALEFRKGEYKCFNPTSDPTVFKCTTRYGIDALYPEEYLLLCDIKENAEPLRRCKWTFIFSSPNKDRYKETLKNQPSFMYTMPTWSYEELSCIQADQSKWNDNFALFGGVPRYVFDNSTNSRNNFDVNFDEKGRGISSSFFASGFGMIDLHQNYMLIHINPPLTYTGQYDYGGKRVLSFASEIVLEKVYHLNDAMILAQATELFNSGNSTAIYGATTAGKIFEKMCLRLKPINGLHINATTLFGDPTPVGFDIPVEIYELLRQANMTNLPVKKFIIPCFTNMESVDAFYVVWSDVLQGYVLVLLQITVAKFHNVKISGIVDIISAFPEDVRNNIKDKALVFVIPHNGELNKEQKYATKNNKVAIRIPQPVMEFKQYVYQHIFQSANNRT